MGVETKRYSEILRPEPEDNRAPEEIARERAERMGITIIPST